MDGQSSGNAIQNWLDNFFKFDIAPEVYSSLIVILIIIILSIVVKIIFAHRDPLKKPSGFVNIIEYGVNFFDNFAKNMFGPAFKDMGGFVMALALYVFMAFFIGLLGLPTPMTYLAIPLSLGLVSFVMIHATAVRFQKWKYFQRYIDPFPIMLPINLLSMWAPLLSLTLRLFGNAIAGYVIMTILYTALEALNSSIFGFLPQVVEGWFAGNYNGALITPIVTGIFHLYFDLFSAFIQTTVFISLTSIFMAQEAPSDISDVQVTKVELQKGEK